MIFTLISVTLGMIVAIPISKIEASVTRKTTYCVVGVVGFFVVTGAMIIWARSIGVNPVGAPGASGWVFAAGLGFMAWRRRSRQSTEISE